MSNPEEQGYLVTLIQLKHRLPKERDKTLAKEVIMDISDLLRDTKNEWLERWK